MNKEIDTTILTIGSDGIMYTECRPNTELDLAEAQSITSATLELLEGKVLPLCCDLSNVAKMSKSCRDHFAGELHATTLTKAALIINDPVSKIIGNFFMGLNKPIKPTKLFTDKEAALKWLKL